MYQSQNIIIFIINMLLLHARSFWNNYPQLSLKEVFTYSEDISVNGDREAMSHQVKSTMTTTIIPSPDQGGRGEIHLFSTSDQQIWTLKYTKTKTVLGCLLLTGLQLQRLPKPFHFRSSFTLSSISKDLLELFLLSRCYLLNFSLWTSIQFTKRKGRLTMRKQVQKPWRRI